MLKVVLIVVAVVVLLLLIVVIAVMLSPSPRPPAERPPDEFDNPFGGGSSGGSAAAPFMWDEPRPSSAPAKEEPAPTRSTPPPERRDTVHLTPGGDFEESPELERTPVACSAFAPATSEAGKPFLLQLLVHEPELKTEAAAIANESDATATRRGYTSLATQLTLGSTLEFEVTCPMGNVDEPRQSVVWAGSTESVSFFITAPNTGETTLPVKVQVFQTNVPIGTIRFMMPLSGTTNVPVEEVPVGEAVRFGTAFASYASEDRAEVLKRVQMLRAVGVKCFQDVLDLEPGTRWEKELWRHIDEADVLLLFWSENAKSSPWVAREWQYGLEHHGLDFILPVILQRNPFVPPPQELSELHFNDSVLNTM